MTRVLALAIAAAALVLLLRPRRVPPEREEPQIVGIPTWPYRGEVS